MLFRNNSFGRKGHKKKEQKKTESKKYFLIVLFYLETITSFVVVSDVIAFPFRLLIITYIHACKA